MSIEPQSQTDFQQLTHHALALPIDQRVNLAHKLWESIERPPGVHAEGELTGLLERRDRELAAGEVEAIEHDEAMRQGKDRLRQLRCE